MAVVKYYDENGLPLRGFTQWTKNMLLAISGADLVPIPKFHFSNCASKVAISVIPDVSDGKLIAMVPDELLQFALPVDIYLYYELEDGSAKVKFDLHIPVASRTKPSNYDTSSLLGYGILGVMILGER